jgi:hypothetical protein
MGSKRHILSRIFSLPDAPLASFGEDIEFHYIAYEEYHRYVMERFREKRLALSLEDAKKLQDALFRIPEAINIVCDFLYSTFQNKTIESDQIFWAIDKVIESRRGRYEELLSLLSEKEEGILTALAKHGPVLHPTGQEFLRTAAASPRAIKMILDYLLDKSIVDRGEEGYRVNDPLLYYFLKRYH